MNAIPQITSLTETITQPQIKCGSCHKAFTDLPNVLSISSTGECCACDHTRGEVLEDEYYERQI